MLALFVITQVIRSRRTPLPSALPAWYIKLSPSPAPFPCLCFLLSLHDPSRELAALDLCGIPRSWGSLSWAEEVVQQCPSILSLCPLV